MLLVELIKDYFYPKPIRSIDNEITQIDPHNASDFGDITKLRQIQKRTEELKKRYSMGVVNGLGLLLIGAYSIYSGVKIEDELIRQYGNAENIKTILVSAGCLTTAIGIIHAGSRTLLSARAIDAYNMITDKLKGLGYFSDYKT